MGIFHKVGSNLFKLFGFSTLVMVMISYIFTGARSFSREQKPLLRNQLKRSFFFFSPTNLPILNSRRRKCPAILFQSMKSISSQVFCNRELNLQQLDAIGFDLDYTLASYKPDFDHLAFNCSTEKLVSQLGYPSSVLKLKFISELSVRGCIVDRIRGNILKFDKHRYVRSVSHGFNMLSRDQRNSIYRESYQESERYLGGEFVPMDSPFSLVDASLFSQLVSLKDASESLESMTILSTEEKMFWRNKSYSMLWHDLRYCVDRSHRDGSIKVAVAAHPERYIHHDPQLIEMLKEFRSAGKKLFLLTNSLWEYSNVVMNYLESKKGGDRRDLAWLNLFDIVFVGANKPAFLLEQSLPVYCVNVHNGSLNNLDDTSSLVGQEQNICPFPLVLQGGDQRLLLRMLGISASDKVLYVGDHVYSDVLRSKRSLGWRTCLIVPELRHEMNIIINHRLLREAKERLLALRREQSLLEELMDELELILLQKRLLVTNEVQAKDDICEEIEVLETLIRSKRIELAQLSTQVATQLASFNAQFDIRWGQILRAGWQESSFAAQMRDNACIFTAKVSNLGQISPLRSIRPTEVDLAPHDLAMHDNRIS